MAKGLDLQDSVEIRFRGIPNQMLFTLYLESIGSHPNIASCNHTYFRWK